MLIKMGGKRKKEKRKEKEKKQKNKTAYLLGLKRRVRSYRPLLLLQRIQDQKDNKLLLFFCINTLMRDLGHIYAKQLPVAYLKFKSKLRVSKQLFQRRTQHAGWLWY